MSDFAETKQRQGREPILGRATAAKVGSIAAVEINGTVVNVQVARDVTVAADDIVIIERTENLWVVTGRLFTAAAPNPSGNGGGVPTGGTSGANPFAPVETRSYRSSGWRTDTTDIYQGQYGGWGNHTGCAFYGSGPRSLAGSTVTAASIAVRRNGAGGITAPQATTLWLVTQSTRPGGAPTLTSSTAGPTLGWSQQNNAFAIPVAWAQAMVNGTAGGLAIYTAGGSPYVILSGNGTWGPSFTLSISWTR